MSTAFSKKKEKRSRSSTSESNNSFVKNVTSRMSGLLPATITKWFSSPSSSGNGSAPAADGTDSSSDDETQETLQPPAKRMRYSTPGSNYNQCSPPELVTPNYMEVQNINSSHTLLYNTIQSPSGRSTFIHEPNYVPSPYISPVEGPNIDIMSVERINRDLTYTSPHIVSATSHSVAVKRKSIFENITKKALEEEEPLNSCEQASTSACRAIKQPSYRPALFGSPFYPGRTMYGGASSANFIHQQFRKHKANAKEPSQDDSTVSMSYSARRVMDLLENYSSPLLEAKRIPSFRNSSYSTDSDLSPNKTDKGYSYKRQELHVPSLASIMRLKQRSRLMDTTKVARQIIASHSSTLSGFQPYEVDIPEISNDYPADKDSTPKMKTRLTRPNRGEDAYKLPEPLELPTAILQINNDNLPKFCMTPPSSTIKPSFSASSPILSAFVFDSKPQSEKASPKYSPAISTLSTTNNTPTAGTPVRGNIFQFASPVTISNHDSQVNNTTLPKFTFGSPECSVDTPKAVEEKKAPQPHSFSFKANNLDTKTTVITTASGKPTEDWKCPDCMITNKAEVDKCVCCGAKQTSGIPVKPVEKCSVCKFAYRLHDADKCINCEKARTQGNNSIPLPIPQPADPSKWKCQGCWATNDEDKVKCDYCSTKNHKIANAPAPEKTEPDWKCSDCLILNKNSVEKCAACGGSKQVGKENPPPSPEPEFRSPFFKPPSAKFAEITNAQKAMWECSGCLVRNEKSKTECMCCGMEREGLSKEITPKPFTFPKESNINFKFGIDPKQQEINIAKKTETVFKMEPTRKLEEPETNNNNIPTFTFTLPNKKIDDKVANILSTDAPNMSFSFGIPKPVTANAAPTDAPSFGNSPPLNEQKPQEGLELNLNVSAQEPAKQFGAGFVSPPQPAQESSPNFSFQRSSTPIPNKEKKASDNPAPAASEQPQTFAFGSGATITATNVFAASTGAPISGFSFGNPQQTAPTTTADPSMPLFQSEPSATPAVHIFGNTDPAPALSTAAAPAASFFNFGNNAQSAAPAPEKAKFNFTFGSGNLEESPFGSGFKPTFGSSDNSGTSNAFAMPSPAPPPSNPLGGNELENNNMSADIQGFNAPAQENLWGANNSSSSNMFGASNNSAQKPVSFTFGSPNPFNAIAAPNAQAAPSAFGSQPADVFGMMGASNGGQQGQLFASPTQSNQPANIFGAQPSVGMFGEPTQPAFGAPAQPAPPYEAPAATPAFNFGMPQASGIFGFGPQQQQQQQLQQQQQQQQQLQQQQQQQQLQQQQQMQSGMYSFGGGMNQEMPGGMNPGMSGGMMSQPLGGGMGGVQFNMGSAPATTTRRVRKAVRRNPQR